jgi:hypothetical protein
MNRQAFHLILAICLICVGRAAVAVPLMVDDFESPDPAGVRLIGVSQPNSQPFQELGNPITLGDQRDVLVSVQGTPKPNSAQVLIGYEDQLFNKGVFQVATASDPGSVITLQYDGVDSNPVELTNAHSLLERVVGGLTIDFLTVDAPFGGNLDVTITMHSNGATATYAGSAPEGATPYSLFAPYASFNAGAGFDFDAVDSFEFVFNASGHPDVDFVIDQIWTVVPEPSAFVLGCVAIAGFVAGRRVRR